jgi:hypothetical protein
MSTPILEPLPGLASQYTRSQNWGGLLVQTSASQIEARQQQQSFARYSWDLTFSYLQLVQRGTYTNAIAAKNYQYLMGFYANAGGGLLSFFYRDQEDNSVTGGFVGVSDGSTLTWQLQRQFGDGNYQPVYGLDTRGAITYGPYTQPASTAQVAYDNGSPVAGATFDNETGILTLASPITTGHTITADFSYLWRVRFEENTLDFKRMWNVIYGLDSLKIIQVLA